MKNSARVVILVLITCVLGVPHICFAKKKASKLNNETIQMPKEEIKKMPVRYESAHMRDPFLTYLKKDVAVLPQNKTAIPKEASLQPPDLQVQAIVTGGKVAQAIINNRVVSVGDRVGEGAQIADIKKDGVTVAYQGYTYFYSTSNILSGDSNPKGERR
ncbi:MAG: hypothetical protein AB1530_02920 [Candidatus Omnitrophota bacterium]